MKMSLRLMSASLLAIVALVTLARHEYSGAWIAFSTGRLFDEHIALMTSDGGAVHRVTPPTVCALNPRWSEASTWIWFESTGCNGSPTGYLQIHPGGGQPEPLNLLTTVPPPDDDRRVMVNTREESDELLVFIESDEPTVIPLAMQRIHEPSYSPDGQWIAFIAGEPGRDQLYRMRPDGSDLQQLTEEPNNYFDLQWSLDSEWLLYTRLRERLNDIFRIRADGSSLEFLAKGSSPGYAPIADWEWHPLWLMIVSAGLMILSVERGRRP